MKITVVILNYLRPDDTIACVRSVMKSGITASQIIVVDNHSPDDSRERITAACPGVLVHGTDQNNGYTGGMNTGIALAMQNDPDLLFVTNSDVVVGNDTIRLLADAMGRYDTAGIAVPSIYYFDDPDRLWYNGGSIRRIRSSGFPATEGRGRISGDAPVFVGFFTGCSFMIRASAVRKVGMFDERFFMYQEDVDLSQRMTDHSAGILYVPAARIDHKVNDGPIRPLPLYYSMRNRLLFASIHLPAGERFLSYLYLHVMILMKMMRWSVADRALTAALRCAVSDFWRGRFGHRRLPLV